MYEHVPISYISRLYDQFSRKYVWLPQVSTSRPGAAAFRRLHRLRGALAIETAAHRDQTKKPKHSCTQQHNRAWFGDDRHVGASIQVQRVNGEIFIGRDPELNGGDVSARQILQSQEYGAAGGLCAIAAFLEDGERRKAVKCLNIGSKGTCTSVPSLK